MLTHPGHFRTRGRRHHLEVLPLLVLIETEPGNRRCGEAHPLAVPQAVVGGHHARVVRGEARRSRGVQELIGAHRRGGEIGHEGVGRREVEVDLSDTQLLLFLNDFVFVFRYPHLVPLVARRGTGGLGLEFGRMGALGRLPLLRRTLQLQGVEYRHGTRVDLQVGLIGIAQA